jgi:hypothetical protein
VPEQARRDPLGLVAGGEGTITGTVVCAAVIAYAGNEAESVWKLTGAILGTVAVYWVAHLHAVTISLPSGTRSWRPGRSSPRPCSRSPPCC